MSERRRQEWVDYVCEIAPLFLFLSVWVGAAIVAWMLA